MNTLVVYDSVYGNTKAVADAIGRAVAGAVPGGAPVRHINEVDPADLEGVDLLILGSPTHGSVPTERVQSFLQRIGDPPAKGP